MQLLKNNEDPEESETAPVESVKHELRVRSNETTMRAAPVPSKVIVAENWSESLPPDKDTPTKAQKQKMFTLGNTSRRPRITHVAQAKNITSTTSRYFTRPY